MGAASGGRRWGNHEVITGRAEATVLAVSIGVLSAGDYPSASAFFAMTGTTMKQSFTPPDGADDPFAG
jgi:hypothetical protein